MTGLLYWQLRNKAETRESGNLQGHVDGVWNTGGLRPQGTMVAAVYERRTNVHAVMLDRSGYMYLDIGSTHPRRLRTEREVQSKWKKRALHLILKSLFSHGRVF